LARPRSITGIHSATNWLPDGYITASAAPSANRIAISSTSTCPNRAFTIAVSAEKHPPQPAARQHAARTKSARKPTSRNLKQGIAHQECAEDPPQLQIINVQ